MSSVSGDFVKRRRDLVVTEASGEVLVYDQTRHHLHHLNAACSLVWKWCDGSSDPAQIAHATGLPRDVVDHALDRLAQEDLLEGYDHQRVAVSNRRAFLRKTAIAGGIALPAIVSVSAPVAADGTSCGQPDNKPDGCACGHNHSVCASGYCGFLTWDATYKVCMPPPW